MTCLTLDLTKTVDVWWAPLDDLTDRERSECMSLLSVAEMARYQAFKVESSRTQFLAARGLLRTSLSRYRAVTPQDWVFRTDRHGRPFVVENVGDAPGPFFSVSHTDGLVICAIAGFPEVGVDVEHRRRTIDIAEVAASVLSQRETAWLDNLADSRKTEAFFTLWTLKEAYAKARGLGLSLPLNAISYTDIAIAPRVSFRQDIADDPARWTFQTILDAPDHIISLAMAPGGIVPQLVKRRARAVNIAD